MPHQCFAVLECIQIPNPNFILIELSSGRDYSLPFVNQCQLSVRASNSRNIAKGFLQFQLFSSQVPNFYKLIITTTKQFKLPIMLKKSNQRIMSLHLSLLLRILVDNPSIISPLVQNSANVNSWSYRDSIAHHSLSVLLTLLLYLFNTRQVHLELFKRLFNLHSQLLFLLYIKYKLLLVD